MIDALVQGILLGGVYALFACGLSLVFGVLRIVNPAQLAGLQLLLARTAIGRAMRATGDDPQTAQLMGLDHRRVYATATAIALGTVALAGVFYGLRGTFTPTLGPQILVFRSRP